ncbi:MAG TPA: metallophosphoesterase family protein [Alphaproteobacteria bacterium]|nr:metallophosphoesterase family protein [Alphaproteobacteria bacterium]
MSLGIPELDLGAMDGPVLVFGGPYGNLEATEAVLAEAARRGIPWRRVVCTGDVAAYCAEPQACADLLRARGIACVMGNCEEQLAADAEDCGCGFEEGTACAALSDAWFAYCRAALDADAKRWMGTLPRRIRFSLGGRSLVAIHGGVERINRFVFASTPAAEKTLELERAGADGILAGHCGIPFAEMVGARLWLNAGAVGMPANDGTARVWYALLTPRAAAIDLRLVPLAYDHGRAAAKMRAKHLPEGYAAALENGLWPSMDVLPEAELAQRGQALSPRALNWPGDARADAAPATRAVGQALRAS